MSWIISDSTKKQNSKNDLSFYHGFSKTPVEPNTSTGNAVTTLANATTKSGHTVSATEVWASEIPWFGLVPSKEVAVTRLSGITKKNDLVRVNGDKDYIYIGEGNETFTVATWSTYWSPITLTNGMVLKNAAGEDVLRYYEKQQMQALEPNNNAGIDSKGYATRLFVDESKHTAVTTVGQGSVISQFAAGTDNIKNGIASSELNPVLYLGDAQKIAGTHYYDYNVSGTILWNANVKSSTPKITCFRYIGKTVSAKTAEIESTIEDLKITAGAGITVTDGTKQKKGVTTLTLGGSNGVTVAVNESTGAVTFSVDTATIATTASVTAISNRISAAASDITATSEKLVTGKAVYDYVSGATLNSGTQGDNQIQSATGDTANKLVTAAQVKEYVTENAQVTVKSGATSVTSTGFEFVGAGVAQSDDIIISSKLEEVTGTDNKKTGKVTYSATLTKADVSSEGEIRSGHEKFVVTAGKAKAISEKAIATALAATGEDTLGGKIATLTERVGEAESNAAASASAAAASETAANQAKTEAAASKTAAQGAQSAAQAAQAASEAAKGEASASATAASQSATAAQGSATSASQSATAASAAQSAAEAAQRAAEAAQQVVETNAEWQAGTDDTLGDFTTATASGVVTGTTVKTVADEVLTLAKSYSDSLHTTSLDYVVLGDSESLPTASADTLGKIYLVKEGNTANGESNIDAISGSYVEYMTRKVSETEYAWEKIGTTAADLTAYAKSVTINGETYTASAANAGVLDLGTVVTALYNTLPSGVTGVGALVNASSVYAGIAAGRMQIGVADASTSDKGLVKLAANVADASATDVTTAKAVKDYAQKALTVKDGRDTVTENDLWGTTATLDENGNLTVAHNWVTNPNAGSAGSAFSKSITKVEDNKIYVGNTLYANVQTERIKDGTYMFYDNNISEFTSDLSNLTNGKFMFQNSPNLTAFNADLSNLTNGGNMFASCYELVALSSDLSNLTNGGNMFWNCSKLETFYSDLPSLTHGIYMFYETKLTQWNKDLPKLMDGTNMFSYVETLSEFNSDLPNLTNGGNMFDNDTALTLFCGDLSSLTDGTQMFQECKNLTTFISDLSSLTNGRQMFSGCKLDTESVEIIADTINTVTSGRIDIKIGNTTPNDEEDAAFKQMKDKGWQVYVNGSLTEYVPRTGEASLDETGETTVAPKPYWAKPIEVTEEEAEFVGADGKFYQVVGGQFIYVTDPDTYGMFVSREDAIANMRLTKYVKPVEEEI